MSIADKNMDRRGTTAIRSVTVNFTSAVSQTATKVFEHQPGYTYEIVSVRVYAQAYTATGSVDVQINGTSVLQAVVTPTAGSEVSGTLKTDVRTLRGTNALPWQIKYTTNGSGVLTNPSVTVSYRKVAVGGYSG